MAILFYASPGWPITYDFTEFTEHDEDNDITVTANQITVDTMRRDASSGLVTNFGSDYFSGDFTFEWVVNCTAGTGSGNCTIFSLSKDYYLTKDEKDDNNDGLYVGMRIVGGTQFRNWLMDADENIEDVYQIGGGPPRERWFTLTRVGTTVTLKIYDDANRTILLDTLQITQSSARSYDRLYPMTSSGLLSNPSDTLSFTLNDLTYEPN